MIKKSKLTKCTEFLKMFGQNKLVCVSDSRKQNSPMIVTTLNSALAYNEKQNHDTYFYVNSGGTKQNQITEINACFVDLDAGRDAKGKYLRPSVVTQKKVKMLEAISKCPLRPTVYTETRNGYQLYWIFTKGLSASLNKDRWNILQNKICHHFSAVGSDSRVLKINQLLRLPHTLWHKKYEGSYDPYLTTISSIGKKYTFSQVATAFKSEKTTKPSTNSWSERKRAQKTYMAKTEVKIVKNSKIVAKSVESEPVASYNTGVAQEVADFLRAVNKILYYGNHKFLANQALRLASELETQSTLDVE